MAQPLLNLLHGNALLQQQAGAGVPQVVELCMTADTYRAAFGEDPQPNLLYCRLAEGVDTAESEGRLATDLLKCRDVAGAQFTHEITASFTQSIDSINYIVVVLIVAAGALAFVVLYNLTNINITERTREIATVKVLGFFPRETASYVFSENFLLCFIAALTGLPMGKALHAFVMAQIRIDMIRFDVRVSLLSYAISVALTFVFAILVNLALRVKLEKINMAESLKTVE